LATGRNEAAFEALMRRHGPMVLGVCRRVLRNEADAEDAFQATFLVLVQKVASIRPQRMVGNWLYGVAFRTALKARAMSTKRLAKEREAAARPRLNVAAESQEQLLALLDQVLKALPAVYRAAIVLCDLEGMSIRETARQLGCPQGTVGSRLVRGRTMLSRRLARHGLAVPGTLIATVIAPNAATAGVPPLLMSSTAKAASFVAVSQAAATGAISPKVAALTEGVLKAMFLTKLKIGTAVIVGVLACAGGGAAVLLPTAAGQQEAKATADDKKTDKEKLQGKWVAVSGELLGAPLDAEDERIKFWKLTFDGDNVIFPTKEGNEGPKCSYTLDPDKTPKEIDIDVGGVKLLGIYEFADGKWKWHWIKGGGRPTDFDTGKSQGILIVFEKQKKE
jgi:RNA polymerase sigma factor (sigma-70 family)